MNTEIVTYTGKIFDLLNPEPEMVCIEDIAHSLAYQCRYTGHTREFYSVAQHCVLMAENSDLPGDPLKKLLHDAAEAYIGDIARPFKNLLKVKITDNENYGFASLNHFVSVGDFEDNIQKVIGLALGVDLTYSAEIKKSDIIMGATEIRDLMPAMPPDFDWGVGISSVVKETIIPWGPGLAELMFTNIYFYLIEKKEKKTC